MARRARSTGEHFDRDLADLPHDLRRREFMGRIEAVLFAYPGSVPREDLLRVVASDCSIDQLIDDIRQELKSRPYDISFVAGGYRIQTKARYAEVLRAMVPQRTPQLSNSDMQILASPISSLLRVDSCARFSAATSAAIPSRASRRLS